MVRLNLNRVPLKFAWDFKKGLIDNRGDFHGS